MDCFLELAKEFSLSGIELRFLNDSPDVGAEMGKYLADPRNARKLAASGVAIPVIGSSLRICVDGEAELAAFGKTAEAADVMGARWLRAFDGPAWGDPLDAGHGERARRLVEMWKTWRFSHRIRARMAIETHGACSSTKVLLRLFDAIGEKLPVIWDAHHTQLVAGESLEETWERIGADVVHVHVKDSVDTPSARHSHTMTLPGAGRFDGPAFIAFLREKGYDGFVSLEWERKWHPYLPPLGDALTALRAAGWR